MVAWLVDSQVAEAVMMGKKVVEECEVEVWLDHVSSSCFNEMFSYLRSIPMYFMHSCTAANAWSIVSNVMPSETILFGTVKGVQGKFVIGL